MDDSQKAILGGIVRHVVGAVGGVLAGYGVMVPGSDLEVVSGAVMVMIMVGWSIFNKVKTK